MSVLILAMIQDQALVAAKRRTKHYLVETKEKSPGHSSIATTVATSENDNSCSEVDDCYSKGHCFPSIGCKCLKNECQSGGAAAICKSDNVGFFPQHRL